MSAVSEHPQLRRGGRLAMSRQTGFTMIEVLVTFVILSIGVLGIVSLLTSSKTAQYESLQRSRAVNIADGMLERIRNNPEADMANDYHTGLTPLGGGSLGENAPSPNCDASNPCNPAQRAASDLWAWERRELDGWRVTAMQGSNPAPTAGLKDVRGCIIFNPESAGSNSGLVTVLVQWRGAYESHDAVDSAAEVCGGASENRDPWRRQVAVTTVTVDPDE